MIGDNMHRNGPDIFLKATVPVWTALLGAELQWSEVAGAGRAADVLGSITVPPGAML
jgi:hypothetical protein